jgi:hypothetical protein
MGSTRTSVPSGKFASGGRTTIPLETTPKKLTATSRLSIRVHYTLSRNPKVARAHMAAGSHHGSQDTSANPRLLQVCGSSHVPTRKAADLGEHEVCAGFESARAEGTLECGGSTPPLRMPQLYSKAASSRRTPRRCARFQGLWPPVSRRAFATAIKSFFPATLARSIPRCLAAPASKRLR